MNLKHAVPAALLLASSGLHPDGAFRDRVVSPDGTTAREVRLTADITAPPPA